MKTLVNYINETMEDGKHGWWEEFEDEDTGDKFSIWRVEDTPEIKKLIEKYNKEEEQEYAKIKERWENWRKTLYEVTQDELDAENELEELKSKRAELYSDMEQEVAHAKEEDKDTVANKWGGELNDLEDELNKAVEKLASARKASQAHIDEEDNILKDEDKYWDKVHKHNDEIHKLREKITW